MQKILKFITRSFAILGFAVFAVSVTGWALLLSHEKEHLPDSIILSLDLTKDIPEAAEHNQIKAALGKSS